MYKDLLENIIAYDTIVIHRHIDPDLDALGAQLGLKGVIEINYPQKHVRVVGDENDYAWLGTMDTVENDFFDGALAVILDVSVKVRVSDTRYETAAEVVIVDHHLNTSDIAGTLISNPEKIATCQMIAEMCREAELRIGADAASCLYAGLISDSGRFLYPSTDETTFETAAYLLRHGADTQRIHTLLYTEPMTLRRLKGRIIQNFKTTQNGVAYIKNDKRLKSEYGVTTFRISRGMVGQMAGLEGIDIWVNFTEDDAGRIHCELRSRGIPVVDVAKKYGGGGHAFACGCIVESFAQADQILADLDKKRAESGATHGQT